VSEVLPFKCKNINDFVEDGRMQDAQEFALMSLNPKDPLHPTGFKVDKVNGEIDIYWGGYRYSIPINDFASPRKLCEWLTHLGQKGESWKGMTAGRVVDLIHVVFHLKGWDLYRDSPAPRESSADEERKKLTPQLRWDVLKRDGYRCRACGSGPEQGAVLQIDHIVPIAKGGTTTYSNLQTLCACCNFGKGVRR
jgi:hypothetical protein